MRTLHFLFLLQFSFFGIFAQNVSVSKKDLSLAEKHYKSATKKSEKGDYNTAIFEYKEAIKFNPNYIEAYNDMGIAYTKLDDYENTISSYNMALLIKPDYMLSKNNKKIAQFNKASKLLNEGNNQKALSFYLDAINTDPNYVDAYNDLAIAYLRLENYELAIKNLNMALTINPDFNLAKNNKASVYCKLGIKMYNSGDYEGAINSYQEAISSSPSYLESYNNIATTYMKLEDFNMAIVYLDKALAISPYSELTKNNKALAYLKRGTKRAELEDNQNAISDYMESIASNPFCEEPYIKAATTFMKLGNQSQSEIYSKKAINIKEIIAKRNEAKVYYSEATKKYESQNYEEAILDYTKAISIYPDRNNFV